MWANANTPKKKKYTVNSKFMCSLEKIYKK